MRLLFPEYVEDIQIYDRECNIINFSTNRLQNYFLNALREYVKLDKEIDVEDFIIEDEIGNKVREQDILYLKWDFDEFHTESKVEKQLILEMKQKLESNEQIFKLFESTKAQIAKLLLNLEQELQWEEYLLDFDVDNITVEALAKITKQKYISKLGKFEESILNNKKAYIDFMMNFKEYKLLVIEMPETMLNRTQMKELVEYLKCLEITLIVLTNEVTFINFQTNLSLTL